MRKVRMNTKREKELLSDLVYFQYLIRSNSTIQNEVYEPEPEPEHEHYDDRHAGYIEVYTQYKKCLENVLDLLDRNRINEEKKENTRLEKKIAQQLHNIKFDLLQAKKSILLNTIESTGVRTIAKEFRRIQNLIDEFPNKIEDVVEDEPTEIEDRGEKGDNGDNGDEGVLVSEENSDSVESSDDDKPKSINEEIHENDNDLLDVVSSSAAEDKIIPVSTKKLSDTFITTNNLNVPMKENVSNSTLLPDVNTLSMNEKQNENDIPIQYFSKTREWGWLSTFEKASPFLFLSRQYETVEHAFNAQKCFDAAYQDLFTQGTINYIGGDPLLAKVTGSKKSFETSLFSLRKDWNSVRVNIMKQCTDAFYQENPTLKEKMINTYPRQLQHTGYKIGTFWGMQKGKGNNEHGKILMNLRLQYIQQNGTMKNGTMENKTREEFERNFDLTQGETKGETQEELNIRMERAWKQRQNSDVLEGLMA